MRSSSLLLIVALAAAPSLAPAQTTTATAAAVYRVEAADSLLYVRGRPRASSLFASLSHPHVIRASQVAGHVRWDPAHPEACEVRLAIPVVGLVVDEPALRAKAGLAGTLDDADRAKVTEHMLDEDQLFGARHPEITFEGAGCVAEAGVDGAQRITVRGRLSVRGHAASVQVPLRVTWSGRGLSAQGELSLSHSDLGLEPYSAGLGTIANDELLRFTLDVRATRR